MTKYEPKNDGIDHINMYSKSLCELGKLLTNFAHTPFEHPKYGRFESVEAAWYFGKTGYIYPQLKNKHGYEAKKAGKQLVKNIYKNDDDNQLTDHFKNFIIECIRLKFWQNKWLLNMLIETDLPLAHYYYYGDINNNPKIIYLNEYEWITETIELIRKKAKQRLSEKGLNNF